MMYVQIKEHTKDKLKLCREPSIWSFSLIGAFVSLGFGAAYYSNDSVLWNSIYIVLGLMAAVSCLEDWEECELDKNSGEVRLQRFSAWDKIQQIFTSKEQQIVLSNLHDIVGVRVDEETVRYFGKGHQVVLLFNTGVNFGITETFTYGNSSEHYMIADKIREFLELEKQDRDNILDTSGVSDDDTSSDEGFEHIDPKEISEKDEIDNVTETT